MQSSLRRLFFFSKDLLSTLHILRDYDYIIYSKGISTNELLMFIQTKQCCHAKPPLFYFTYSTFILN